MRSAVKGAALALVTAPMLAYVAARLVATPADPGPHPPVILPAPVSSPSSSSPSAPPPGASPATSPGDGEEDPQDREVRVVNPAPTRVGEDDGAPAPEGEHDDDDEDDESDTDDGDDGGGDDGGGDDDDDDTDE